jgi:hypothetical protein
MYCTLQFSVLNARGHGSRPTPRWTTDTRAVGRRRSFHDTGTEKAISDFASHATTAALRAGQIADTTWLFLRGQDNTARCALSVVMAQPLILLGARS